MTVLAVWWLLGPARRALRWNQTAAAVTNASRTRGADRRSVHGTSGSARCGGPVLPARGGGRVVVTAAPAAVRAAVHPGGSARRARFVPGAPSGGSAVAGAAVAQGQIRRDPAAVAGARRSRSVNGPMRADDRGRAGWCALRPEHGCGEHDRHSTSRTSWALTGWVSGRPGRVGGPGPSGRWSVRPALAGPRRSNGDGAGILAGSALVYMLTCAMPARSARSRASTTCRASPGRTSFPGLFPWRDLLFIHGCSRTRCAARPGSLSSSTSCGPPVQPRSVWYGRR